MDQDVVPALSDTDKGPAEPVVPLAMGQEGVCHRLPLGRAVRIECCDCRLTHNEVYLPDPDDPAYILCYSYRDDETTCERRAE